jgi:hypothetical protein
MKAMAAFAALQDRPPLLLPTADNRLRISATPSGRGRSSHTIRSRWFRLQLLPSSPLIISVLFDPTAVVRATQVGPNLRLGRTGPPATNTGAAVAANDLSAANVG